MASKSFSTIFLAMLFLVLLSGESIDARKIKPAGKSRKFAGAGGDFCRRSDNPALCKSVAKGQKSPYAATQATVRRLISETSAAAKRAAVGMAAAAKKEGKKSAAFQSYEVCVENFNDALSSLKQSIGDMNRRDKGGFNSNLSAAISDYVTCDDTFDEMGEISPFVKSNNRLKDIAGNGLYLATLWH